MLVYYQDFGTTSSYRIQNWSASLGVLKARLRSPLFPSFAPGCAAPAAAAPRRHLGPRVSGSTRLTIGAL